MVREVFKEFVLPSTHADGKLNDSSCANTVGHTTLLPAIGKLEDFSGASPQIKDDPGMMDGPPTHGEANNHDKDPVFSEDEETEEEDDDDIPLGEKCNNFYLSYCFV